MDKKVVVLLSTYNGEKYIKQQIDSILKQDYKNIGVIVRDDGSQDNTSAILKQYEKDGKITLILGNNIGFVESFLKLLKLEEADYYAFCDQDDIWKEDKIQKAVEKLENENSNTPLLYCSNYEICDETGKIIAKHKKMTNVSFANSLVECIAPGMTMVINNKTRKLLLAKNMKECYYHDWWIYLVCASMGKVIYDEYESVLYRRHKKTVTNSEKNPIKQQLWRIKQILKNDYFKNTKKQIKSFYEQYEESLSLEYKKMVEQFTSKYSLKTAVKKAFYTKPYRNGILDEILIRIIMIMGCI